ncbi:valine--tRNA ligase-like, partial [Sylvia borin]
VSPGSLPERWVRSRLSRAVGGCGAALGGFDFPGATTAVHSFWVYELCDVYLEGQGEEEEEEEEEGDPEAARATLLACLDAGLRLLAPFMPFLAEELWQRLPPREPPAPPSICLAPFPEPQQFCWQDEEAESTMEFLLGIVRALRSLRAAHGLTRQRPPCFLQCPDPSWGSPGVVSGFPAVPRPLLVVPGGPRGSQGFLQCPDPSWGSRARRHRGVLRALGGVGPVRLLAAGEGPPPGCAVGVASDRCTAHLLLKGVVDPPQELARLGGRRQELGRALERLRERRGTPEYPQRVPPHVREADGAK